MLDNPTKNRTDDLMPVRFEFVCQATMEILLAENLEAE